MGYSNLQHAVVSRDRMAATSSITMRHCEQKPQHCAMSSLWHLRLAILLSLSIFVDWRGHDAITLIEQTVNISRSWTNIWADLIGPLSIHPQFKQ